MDLKLLFNKNRNVLVGNDYGLNIYNKQIKNKINFNEHTIIHFPEQIKDISISFVQGFTSEILKEIDKSEFFKYFTILGNDKVVEKFKRSLYY